MKRLHKVKDGSFVVLTRHNDDEVFLVLRSDRPLWNLPGGGIEAKESPKEAAIRETFEETGFNLNDIQYIGNYINLVAGSDKLWNKTYLFQSSPCAGDFVPEFDGCEGKWFHRTGLPKNIQAITAIRIRDALNGTELRDKIFRPEYDTHTKRG